MSIPKHIFCTVRAQFPREDVAIKPCNPWEISLRVYPPRVHVFQHRIHAKLRRDKTTSFSRSTLLRNFEYPAACRTSCFPRRSCTNRVAASAVGLARPACKGITRTFLNGVAELFGIRYTRETSYLRNFLIRGKQALFKLVPRWKDTPLPTLLPWNWFYNNQRERNETEWTSSAKNTNFKV